MSQTPPPTQPPKPVLSPKAQAALAKVQRKRRQPAQRRVDKAGPRIRWGLLLAITMFGVGGVWYLRIKADENLARVKAQNEAIAAMERAYGGAEAVDGIDSGEIDSAPGAVASDGPEAARRIPRPPPGWRAEAVLQPDCRIRSAAVEPKPSAPMYKWRDADGALQFGRQPPEGVSAQRVAVSSRNSAQFKLAVGAGDGSPIPPQLRDRATADTYRIVAILRQELGVPVAEDFTLNLSFVSSAEDVGRDLGMGAAAGVYLPLQQRMVIWRQPDLEQTFATVRHESVHALMHEFIGAPPVWLNEGLAEYLENLKVSGSGGTIGVSAHHRQLLATLLRVARVEAALAMLDANAVAFRSAGRRELNYALAWSIIHYLMRNESGQAVLGQLLAEVREAGCSPYSSREFFDRTYTGGARDLITRAVASTADRSHYY